MDPNIVETMACVFIEFLLFMQIKFSPRLKLTSRNIPTQTSNKYWSSRSLTNSSDAFNKVDSITAKVKNPDNLDTFIEIQGCRGAGWRGCGAPHGAPKSPRGAVRFLKNG